MAGPAPAGRHAGRAGVPGLVSDARLGRTDIKLIRITEFRRIGRKVRLLELDTVDGRLVVLSRWDLGGDPIAVLDALTDAGYAGPERCRP